MSRRRFELMIQEMDTIIGQMQTLHFRHRQYGRGWQPAMNVYSYPHHFELFVEVAGVPLTDVHIEVEGRLVRIFGVRRWPDLKCKTTGSACRRTTLMEIEEGSFMRELELPQAVDRERGEVQAQDGLVWIRLPLL